MSPASLVVLHARVWTMDPALPAAEAVAVQGDRVVFVGDDAGVQAYIGPDTRVVDAAGRVVLPGFVDAHVHPAEGGLELGLCALQEGSDTEELLALVRACDEAAPGRGWLVGAGWDLTAFPGGAAPAGALDTVVADRPVYLESADGHSAWVNGVALARAKIDASTPDPPGGRIERDADGRPTGTLREDAVDRVDLPTPTRRAWQEGIVRAVAHAHEHGITSLYQAKLPDVGVLKAYRRLDRRGELGARVTVALTVEPDDRVEPLEKLRRRFGSERVRPIAAKIFVDGVIEARTAAMLAPYTDTGEPGEALWTRQALTATVGELAAAGFDVHFHAIGDAAVRMSLDAIEAARGGAGASRRFSIAHLEAIDAADVPRFAALRVAPVFQPLWAYPDAYIVELTVPGLGPERSERLYPIGELDRSGAALAFGSDWSVSSLDPLLGIEVAVTRRDPDAPGDALGTDQGIGVARAVEGYTRGAAEAVGDPEAGWLRVGGAADWVLLDADPREVEPEALSDIGVVLTVAGGEVVWVREGGA